MTNDNPLNRGAASRLGALEVPDEAQILKVIETPFKFNDRPILLGRRFSGYYIALIPVADIDIKIITPQKLTSGFQVLDFHPEVTPMGPGGRFLELRNISNVDLILFGAILDEIISNLVEDQTVLQQISSVLARWRDLLTLEKGRILPLNSIVGLMGELKFLDFLVSSQGESLVDSWVGPDGNRHDFEFATASVEVKSTVVKQGSAISIHGFDQMTPYAGKSVRILRVKLEPDPSGTSLIDLVNRISGLFRARNRSLMEKLQKVGLHTSQYPLYEKIRFQFVEFQYIPITPEFPLITRSAISQVPGSRNIQNIEYMVDVGEFITQFSSSLSELDWSGVL